MTLEKREETVGPGALSLCQTHFSIVCGVLVV
jgi:hypothetical protein